MLKPGRIALLQYLVAFEASARHSGFKSAAEELNVTASAVGQQIKSLEGLLGLDLFIRKARSVQLTKAGESFYQIANNTLSNFDNGYEQFAQQFYSATLNVSMVSDIADEVVIPRLHEFKNAYPHINLLIETTMRLVNLVDSNVDCAIRTGIPPWENCQHNLISGMSANLLASKQYLADNPIDEFSDLHGLTIIHSQTNRNNWQLIMDIFNFTPGDEIFLDSYSSAIKAAEHGLGVALGAFPSANKIVKEGKLVQVFPVNFPIEDSYYFVTKTNSSKQESYDIFQAWLESVFSEL